MALKIITDHKWKNFIYGCDLPKSKRKDFDWIDDEDFPTHSFMKYRKRYYSSEEFMRIEYNVDLKGWDGYHSDSFFSEVVIKLSKDGEQYQIGLYLT